VEALSRWAEDRVVGAEDVDTDSQAR